MKKSLLQVAAVMLVFSTPAAPVLADEATRDDSRNCLSTRRLKSTAVIDDKNILFVMTGDQVYHNVLSRQCSGLAKAGAFTYSTLGGNVCRQDTIQVLLANSDLPGRTCTLGAFHLVAPQDLRALIEGLRAPVEPVEAQPPAKVEEIGEAEEGGVR